MDDRSIGAVLGALVTALGWVLVDRLKKARRIMPRARVSLRVSLETPTSEPAQAAPTEAAGGVVSWEPAPYPDEIPAPPRTISLSTADTLKNLPPIVIKVEEIEEPPTKPRPLLQSLRPSRKPPQ